MQYCNQKSLAVVPQGGNTGLVGGSVPVHDEIVLSLSRMSTIIDFDEVSAASHAARHPRRTPTRASTGTSCVTPPHLARRCA
jgi:hypothetical protein